VLDHEHRQALLSAKLPDESGEVGRLLRVHAGRWLVEQ
jgi:hypothetical protein